MLKTGDLKKSEYLPSVFVLGESRSRLSGDEDVSTDATSDCEDGEYDTSSDETCEGNCLSHFSLFLFLELLGG
jgi:hypothetical protein